MHFFKVARLFTILVLVKGRVKQVTSGRKRQKRGGMPTDVALQMAPLTDSRIIYENIAPSNGRIALPSGKYRKFGSRGPFCRRSLAIFFLHPREETGGKRGASGKIGNGSTFLANERERGRKGGRKGEGGKERE